MLSEGRQRKRINILHVVPAFYPATYWGGPITSLFGLCNSLAARPGLELKVLSTDTAGPRLSERLEVTQFPMRYPAGYDVFFTRRRWGKAVSPGLLTQLWPMIRWADVVHLTGTYSFPVIPTLLLCRMLRKPVVWSPQGALQRWAGSSRPWAKWFWEQLCNALLVKGRSVLHVTSRDEGHKSASRIPRADIACIPNGIDLPILPRARAWKTGGGLHLLYIGRLDPIKGIENLLVALPKVSGVETHLAICGRGATDYEEELQWLVSKLGLREPAPFRGMTHGQAKNPAFLEADLCVVPSFTENFGMVVAEALAHGGPVIASRGTPWAEFETRDSGLWGGNSPESLAKAITAMSQRNLQAMGVKCLQCMETAF